MSAALHFTYQFILFEFLFWNVLTLPIVVNWKIDAQEKNEQKEPCIDIDIDPRIKQDLRSQ